MALTTRSIDVEVVYAEPARAVRRTYQVHAAATIADVMGLAAADPAFAGVDLAAAAVGVFGKLAAPGQVLQAGDRVEVYRPLAEDPKDARRERARNARKQR